MKSRWHIKTFFVFTLVFALDSRSVFCHEWRNFFLTIPLCFPSVGSITWVDCSQYSCACAKRIHLFLDATPVLQKVVLSIPIAGCKREVKDRKDKVTRFLKIYSNCVSEPLPLYINKEQCLLVRSTVWSAVMLTFVAPV